MRTADTPTGTLLGGRYLLTRPLGAGASATVYLAEDRSLRREVAVKVLRTGITSDDAFLKRFRAEAVAVAGLNHPHVLRVFDWGEGDGTAWLVTEYLAGGSLRELLNDKGVLPLEQVASIGAQAADGLAYAHERGFVHRDVKPTNLLFDDAGRVRITDFGVARALAEAAWTEPPDGLIGTVRYSAPEQVLGRRADPKSDVYSLAIVLYECATGVVPFTVDSQVATLHARVGAELPEHPALGQLYEVLRDAAAPEPATRLDAAGLWSRLTEVARGMPHPPGTPQARHPASAGFTPPTPDELTGQRRPVATTKNPRPPMPAPPLVADRPPSHAVDSTLVGGSPAREADAPRAPKPPRTRTTRRWPTWVAVVVAVALAVAGGLYATRGGPPATFRLPDEVGQSWTVVQARLGGHHLKFTAVLRTSKTVPPGVLLGQHPAPGTRVRNGTSFRGVVSAGPPPVAVPAVVGRWCLGAVAALQAVGFTARCPVSLAAYSTSIPAGEAIGVYLGNADDPETAAYGSALLVQLSKGLPPRPVPQVVGLPGLVAVARLQRAGFAPVVIHQFSMTVPDGNVISTSPAAREPLQPNKPVDLYVSEGAPITVPALGHLTLAEAEKAIVNAGLTVLAVHGATNSDEWTSDPAPGTKVPKGTDITLYAR